MDFIQDRKYKVIEQGGCLEINWINLLQISSKYKFCRDLLDFENQYLFCSQLLGFYASSSCTKLPSICCVAVLPFFTSSKDDDGPLITLTMSSVLERICNAPKVCVEKEVTGDQNRAPCSKITLPSLLHSKHGNYCPC